MTPDPYDRGPEAGGPGSWIRSRSGITFGVLGLGALYFLVTEHLAHTLQALPWIILLLCPLMHVFMHGGHGHDGGGHAGHGDRGHVDGHSGGEDGSEGGRP